MTRPPDAFDAIGTLGSLHATSSIASAIFAWVGFISSLWKAAPTWSGTTFSAPASCASSISRSTPATSPETTICAGVLRFAGATSPASDACAQSSARRSASSPITAAIVPGVSVCASFISLPRKATSRMPSSSETAPDAAAAVYSPRLCPATKSGRIPSSPAASASASDSEKSAGCATSVRVSDSIGPSSAYRRIGRPEASSASAK